MKISSIPKDNLATDGSSYLALLSSNADWIARNQEDVEKLRKHQGSALNKLDNESYLAFRNSIEFKHNGLAHASYAPLRSLTISEIAEVFSYFGLSGPYFLDRSDYYCASAGTCSPYREYVCTSAC
ncbi:hypothetical protein GOL32_28890 [Sinorhizobium medicae]|nr:hypothetical protein [Sinorhizobium medicae]